VRDLIRVLVVDDQLVMRKGIAALLADAADIAVVGEAADRRQAVAEARRLEPQVVLMDLMLPELDGVGAIRAILAEEPDAAIVVMTGSNVESHILAALEAGAVGHLSKSALREEFLEAIRRVAHGDAWLPPGLARRLLAQWQPRPAAARAETLTQQEREVLRRVARGWSNRRIAGDLSVADSTVRTHVSRILGKLGVSNRIQAALYALRANLVTLEEP
jgi:DNA-binding NarL/FixJ family response regulator